MKSKLFSIVLVCGVAINSLWADEGMLIPLLIKAFESDMQARGNEIDR